MKGKTTIYVLSRVVREVVRTRIWFGSIFVIYCQIHKDVRGSGLQVFSLFSNVDLLAWCRGYAVDYIGGVACKSIIDVDGPYRCRDPVSVLGERTSFASSASAFEGP